MGNHMNFDESQWIIDGLSNQYAQNNNVFINQIAIFVLSEWCELELAMSKFCGVK